MSSRHLPVGRALQFFLHAALLIAFLGPSTAQAQETGGSTKPESVIREFYQWYVQAVLADRSPMNDRAKLKQYASVGMLRRIDKAVKADELGFDPFLHAQDLDKAWAKNITVSKPKIAGEVATADVELKGPEMGTHKLALTLRQEGGAWKIDKVDQR